MQVDREGIFLATIGEHSVAPKGKNKLTAFQASFNITQEMSEFEDGSKGFADVSDQAMSIADDFYLEKVDGSLSEKTIAKLKEATGWDGRDPFWLEESLPADLVVKLTVSYDSPNDPKYKPKLRVQWLDHKDAVGSGAITHATDAEKKAIRDKLGQKLRAVAGGTPTGKPPLPAGKPALPVATVRVPANDMMKAAADAKAAPVALVAPPPAPAPDAATMAAAFAAAAPTADAAPKRRGRPPKTQPPPLPPTATVDEAFAEFVKDIKPGTAQERIDSEWGRILTEMFPEKDDDAMTPEDWAKVRDEAPSKFVPF